MNTFGIISRICKSELPYIYAFTKHHLSIGFSSIYFIIQDSTLKNEIESLLSDFSNSITINIQPSYLSPNDALSTFDINITKNDYLLLADIDEFFYSTNLLNVNDIFEILQYPNFIHIQWILCPSDFNELDRQKGFLGNSGKMLAKKILIDSILDPHRFKLKHNDNATFDLISPKKTLDFLTPEIFLLHYWGRNFNDILLKCLFHKKMGVKTSSKKEVDQISVNKFLPTRLKYLAMLTSHIKYINTPDLLNNLIDWKMEEYLINEKLSSKKNDLIKEIYLEYKNKLDFKKHIAIYPSNSSLITLTSMLP